MVFNQLFRNNFGLIFCIFFKKFLPLFFLLLLANSSIKAQNSKTIFRHKAFWLKSEITEIFKNKFGVGADIYYRSTNEMNEGHIFSRFHRVSFRPWVHYQIGPNMRASISPLGYFKTNEYVGQESDLDREPYNELRTTFNLVHHQKNLKERFTHTFRHRLEIRRRFPFEDNAITFFRFRTRYRLRFLINKDYYSENNVVYTWVANEILISYGDNIVRNMFSQNRVMVALGYRFLNSARIEVRYVNRLRGRSTGFEFDNAQALFIGIFIDQLSSIGTKKIQPVQFFE